MIKRMIIMLMLCTLVLGGVFGFKVFGKMMMLQGMAAMGSAPKTVASVKVDFKEWSNDIDFVGSFVAQEGTDLASEDSGIVESIAFESGQDVEAGAILLRLRSAEEEASLKALETSLALAEKTLSRSDKQIKANAISQAVFDADKANAENLRAQVARARAALDKKIVRAPFAGRLGLRRANVGQFIQAGTAVVSLQRLDALYLDFSVPQNLFSRLALGQKTLAKTDAFPERVFEGTVAALEPAIDEKTRTVMVRADVPNPEKLLRPGMFATLALKVGTTEKALTLPQTAITFNPYGSTVFIVVPSEATEEGQPQKQVKLVFVKTGQTRGDQIAILDGLKEGDEVVVSGQMKLRNGTPVVINNAVLPTNDPAPQPQDE